MAQTIYLDHAATTPVRPEVLAAMEPYFTSVYANPATIYSMGMEARSAVNAAREIVAGAMGADPDEVYFTSGGTESDNWAVRSGALANAENGRRVLVSSIEHHAVLESACALKEEGFEVEFLPVDGEGFVTPDVVREALRRPASLVSVMHVNNEIGTIEPIAEIGEICRERGVLFHTDAVQSFGKIPIDVRSQNIDMLSISGHKIYGPKGIGAFFLNRNVAIEPFMHGGAQECGKRAGTLNVPGIVGLGKATECAVTDLEPEAKRLSRLRDLLIACLFEVIPGVVLNGSRRQRLPGNVNICIPGAEGETLLLALDEAGISASAGSACSTGSTEPSHVLTAIGVPRELARGSLRLTLGISTTEADIQRVASTIVKITDRITKMRAPL